jgi:hemoglobin-like flavoprotein
VATISDVIDSFRRCQESPDFCDRFYARLFEARPDVRPLFDRVDPRVQHMMVRKGVTMMLLHVAGVAGADRSFDMVRTLHGPGGLGVSPAQLAAWGECMVATVREADPLCTDALADHWREVLSEGIRSLMG